MNFDINNKMVMPQARIIMLALASLCSAAAATRNFTIVQGFNAVWDDKVGKQANGTFTDLGSCVSVTKSGLMSFFLKQLQLQIFCRLAM